MRTRLLFFLSTLFTLSSSFVAAADLNCAQQTFCGVAGQQCSDEIERCSRSDEACDSQNWLVGRSRISLDTLDFNESECSLKGAKLTVDYKIDGCDMSFAIPYDPGKKGKENDKVKVKLVKWDNKKSFPKTDSGNCTLPTNADDDLGCAPQSRLRGDIVKEWNMIPQDNFPKATMTFQSATGDAIRFDGAFQYSLEAELYEGNLLTGRARKILSHCNDCKPPTGLENLIGLSTSDTSKGGEMVGPDQNCSEHQGPRLSTVSGSFQGTEGCYYLVCVGVEADVTGHDQGPFLDYVRLNNQTVITGHYGKLDCNNVVEKATAPVNLTGYSTGGQAGELKVDLTFDAGECFHHQTSAAKITSVEYIRSSRSPIPIDPASCPCAKQKQCEVNEMRDPYNGCECAPCNEKPQWGQRYKPNTPDVQCDIEDCPNSCPAGYMYNPNPSANNPCECVRCGSGSCPEGYKTNPDIDSPGAPCCVLCPDGPNMKSGVCQNGTSPKLDSPSTCDCTCQESESYIQGACRKGTVSNSGTPDNICDCICPPSADIRGGECINGKVKNVATMDNLCDCICPPGTDKGDHRQTCPAFKVNDETTPYNACDCRCADDTDMGRNGGSCPEGMIPDESTPNNPCDCICRPGSEVRPDGSCPEGKEQDPSPNVCDCRCKKDTEMGRNNGSCEPGRVPDESTPNLCDCKCSAECPPGQERNLDTPDLCDCRCPSGSDMGTDGTCPEGKISDEDTPNVCDCKCEPCDPGLVPVSTPDGSCACRCENECKSPYIKNPDTPDDPCDCMCPSCAYGVPSPTDQNPCACACPTCPDGQTPAPTPENPCACKPTSCLPPAGGCGNYGWKGEPECACGTCTKTCKEGETLNFDTCTCEPCEPPQGGCPFGMDAYCECLPCQPPAGGCPFGMNANCECLPNNCPPLPPITPPCTVPSVDQNGCVIYLPMQPPLFGCPPNSVWNGCLCVPGPCQEPFGGCQRGTFNPDTCACECKVSCKSPARRNEDCTGCECPDRECVEGKNRNPETCRCECEGNEAPNFAARRECEDRDGAWEWDNLNCECDCAKPSSACDPGEVVNRETCACECPAGSDMGTDGSCPGDDVPNSDTPDVCDCKCPTPVCDDPALPDLSADGCSCTCNEPPCPPKATPTPSPSPGGTAIPVPTLAPAPEAQQSALDFGTVSGLAAVGAAMNYTKEGSAEGEILSQGGLDLEIIFTDSIVSRVKTLLANVFQGDKKSIRMPPLPENAGTPSLHRRVGGSSWQPVPTQSFSNVTLSAQITVSGYYQVFVPISNLPFQFGEVYVFPNPAKKGQPMTLHVEIGQASKVTARIYDAAGDLVYESRVDENPVAVQGKAAYEHVMGLKRFTSGVYSGVVTAEKAGKETLRKKFRFAVVK